MKTILILPLLFLALLANAQRDPQWLMPLYFRDANGDRDTVYFGYDPEANMYHEIADTSLGENWIVIDTSQFNIYLWSYPNTEGGTFYLYTDTVRKVDIRNASIGAEIGFCKGKLPITMKWVDSLLYAPSIPFPDLSPRPRARIDLTCSEYDAGYWSCNPIDGPPLSLTDYPAPEIDFPIADSMVFDGSGLYPPSNVIFYLKLRLVHHNHVYLGHSIPESESMMVFPNPFTDQINIETVDCNLFSVRILNLTGVCLIHAASHSSKLILDGSILSKGIYLVELKTDRTIFIQKIVKTELN
jgi:hypothetical protein